ncbi:hypothetical protein AgCh_012967 [Apium graveolens]
MKEVTFKNVKCKTGGLIPRKGDARGMHKGWHFTLNRDSMSFDSMNWKGLRVYPMKDLRITLEVLQGERTKLSKIEAAEKGVVKLWWFAEWKHIRDTKVDEASRCRLMRSLREDNVDLPYVRMKL